MQSPHKPLSYSGSISQLRHTPGHIASTRGRGGRLCARILHRPPEQWLPLPDPNLRVYGVSMRFLQSEPSGPLWTDLLLSHLFPLNDNGPFSLYHSQGWHSRVSQQESELVKLYLLDTIKGSGLTGG